MNAKRKKRSSESKPRTLLRSGRRSKFEVSPRVFRNIWKVLRYNVRLSAVDVEEARIKLKAKMVNFVFAKWRS